MDKNLWHYLSELEEVCGGESEALEYLLDAVHENLPILPRTNLYQLLDRQIQELRDEEEDAEDLPVDEGPIVLETTTFTVNEILRANGITPPAERDSDSSS